MGRARNRPKLLPDKLLAIRDFLSVDRAHMASELQSEMLSRSGHQYRMTSGRISEWEKGRREPDLLVIIAYVRLAQIHIESLVDDDVDLERFRGRLGKEFDYVTWSRPTRKKRKAHYSD